MSETLCLLKAKAIDRQNATYLVSGYEFGRQLTIQLCP